MRTRAWAWVYTTLFEQDKAERTEESADDEHGSASTSETPSSNEPNVDCAESESDEQ